LLIICFLCIEQQKNNKLSFLMVAKRGHSEIRSDSYGYKGIKAIGHKNITKKNRIIFHQILAVAYLRTANFADLIKKY